MTDNKLTDNEIIKALECCSSGSYGCENGCPLDKECDSPIRGGEKIMKSALDLINRLQTEIEHIDNESSALLADIDFRENEINRLQAENERLKENLNIELENYATEYDNKIKAEAYNDFAQKLESIIMWSPKNHISITAKDVRNILNGLVGEDNV